ncbi:MAG: helix-turn-helix domain-containing protein [bacterium]
MKNPITHINNDREEFKEIIKILFDEIKNLKKETASPAKLLTFEEAMDVLRIGKSKLYEMVGRQEIPCIRIDRIIRFDTEDLKKFIENKKKEGFKFEFNVNSLKGGKYLKK